MTWALPSYPLEPRAGVSIQRVPDAILTGIGRGHLQVLEAPKRWVRGAVHDLDGQLVASSQRIGGLSGDHYAASDQLQVSPEARGPLLAGTWLYGGHWMNPFGHFVTETLTTLWPPTDGLDGVVFHSWLAPVERAADWQRELVELAGYGSLPLRFVGRQRLRVEELLVPTRSYVPNGWAHPEAAQVWRRISAPLRRDDGPRRVHLSRTRFNAELVRQGSPTRSTSGRDQQVDAAFADAGFEVVFPEELPVREQVRLMAGARVIAGAAGASLHLAAFASAPADVIEVGDRRSPDAPVPNQTVVNAACGHRAAFVLAHLSPEVLLAELDLA